MNKKDEAKKKNTADESEGLPFSGFFKGLSKLIDLAEKLKKEGGYSQTKEFKIPTGQEGKEIKGVYGFTVRTMASGEPRIEPFGNIKKVQKIYGGSMAEESREPIVDVFDEKDHILVVAELPGVEESQVHYEIKGDILVLSTDHPDRKYSKEILLNTIVDEKPKSVSFKNGIFELKLLKAKQKK